MTWLIMGIMFPAGDYRQISQSENLKTWTLGNTTHLSNKFIEVELSNLHPCRNTTPRR